MGARKKVQALVDEFSCGSVLDLLGSSHAHGDAERYIFFWSIGFRLWSPRWLFTAFFAPISSDFFVSFSVPPAAAAANAPFFLVILADSEQEAGPHQPWIDFHALLANVQVSTDVPELPGL